MAFETIILLILMVSIVLKANIFSIIYLIFILRYVTSRAKTHLLVRMAMYVSVCLACQYFLFMLNLTDHTSPAPFPAQLVRVFPLVQPTAWINASPIDVQ